MTNTDTLTAEQAGAAILRLALEKDTPGMADALALADRPTDALLAAFLLATGLLRKCQNHEHHVNVASRITLDLYQEPDRT